MPMAAEEGIKEINLKVTYALKSGQQLCLSDQS